MAEIDRNIAENLKRIRKSRNMSLDMVSELSGVSKSMLGQIERGESNPTVTTIQKIVEGLKISFEQLIYNKTETVTIVNMDQAPVMDMREGEYRICTLLPFEAGRSLEVYGIEVEPGRTVNCDAYSEYAWAYLTVLKGDVELRVNEENYRFGEDDSFYFACDRKHSFSCVGFNPAKVNIVMTKGTR